MRATVAGFFGGDIVTLRPSIRARYGETLSLSLSYSRNDIDLPKGSVTTNLTSLRFAYNFSPRLFAQTLLQHNNSADPGPSISASAGCRMPTPACFSFTTKRKGSAMSCRPAPAGA